ncbi:outer membrane beta-barrel protein [Flavicella sp.]|uniref:outer membrane beta-barrel protein n=1 Tax=Flavicella sp. TaxID=2957742 RepID=UPI00263949AA|nr:outer membrane beta-barrel protein [Flavicella sp.]MDG1806166.1 TonB-dependent receptor [Flavicella sp.]
MLAFPFPKTQLTTLIFLFIAQFILAQTEPSITGRVATPENESLPYASVALLNPKDSTMINFTTTDMDGKFKILEDSRDSLLIQIHSTGFISHFENIVFRNEPIDLNNILLKEDIGVLDEVTISAVIPIQIKKDTVAFNTSAFKVNHDDNIEDMLEKLPGMEIDSDGKMIAQGNEVTKIYVDGKEFFGGDPSVVMKNLSADVIAKVEIIDKKSDESELTGVSDGNKQVILNFTLKKDKKNRAFGKASAGIGLDNRYFASGNYNQFSSKTQFSAVVSTNNINVTGSNIKNFLKSADGLGDESDGEESTINKKSLSGFLNSQVAGLHFGHEFKKKESLNADYTFNQSQNDGTSYTNRVSSVNENNINSNIVSNFDNYDQNHNLNFNYKNQANNTYSYFAKGMFNASDRIISLNKFSQIYNTENILRTTNDSKFNNAQNRHRGNLKLNFYKKLNEEGKNFAVGAYATTEKLKRFNQQYTETTRNLDQETPSVVKSDIYRDELIDNNSINYNIKYTEPLGHNHYIKIEAFNTFRNIDEDVVQSKTTITDDNRQDLFEYKYNHKEYNYQSRLGYSYNIEKLNIYAGAEYQDLTRDFGELEKMSVNKKNSFINPRAFIQYKPKAGRKYRLNYKKSVRSPNIYHSSTVVNDLIPRFIRKGNPNISAEQRDDLSARVNIHDYKSALTFYGLVNLSHTKDAIIPTIEIDEDLNRVRSFENIGIKDNITTSFSLSKKINRLPVRYTIKNRNSFQKSNSLINYVLNDVSANRYSGSLRFENHNKNIFDFKIGAEYSMNQTNFSIRKELNREFATQHYFTKFDYDFTKKLSFNTQFDYYLYSYDTATSNENFSTDVILPLWNTAISYSFTPKKNNVVKLILIDMLNKNVDIRRRSSVNYFEETSTESLGMYAVVSYTYRLNNGARKKLKKGKKS